jgi:hypothetical protein
MRATVPKPGRLIVAQRRNCYARRGFSVQACGRHEPSLLGSIDGAAARRRLNFGAGLLTAPVTAAALDAAIAAYDAADAGMQAPQE